MYRKMQLRIISVKQCCINYASYFFIIRKLAFHLFISPNIAPVSSQEAYSFRKIHSRGVLNVNLFSAEKMEI